ncbi:MAG: bifunctional 2-C-methyl-D-erythritol 4-phosphate cytidylyltransferase/2-C-methyl-D-erythritol 2,4-cyclodiphosphate synthase [Methylobacteriaceae bacterium]|nr:bifunctional 2-C-methyl-D-erythritol 4-phosphate cytidylyltransferase/2-C-methyl-D-erythritol 2,4-cyclodiphosphate synthase [Methylobacteriaceae bacterium]
MNEAANVAILVVAGGRGTRVGGDQPKQYRPLLGLPLLTRTLANLAAAAPDAHLRTVIHPDDREAYDAALCTLSRTSKSWATPAIGGPTRQQSVRNGLEALAADGLSQQAIVLVHDAARPFPSRDLVARAIESARSHGAAVPGLPLTDTVKQVAPSGRIHGSPDRATLRTVQTPQAFRFDVLLAAHRQAADAGEHDLTDDAAVVERAGHAVYVFDGEKENVKLTTADDFSRAEARLLGELADIRCGQGFDVHAFGAGDHVWLGGLKIPHDQGLEGHSDADVLAHAITDAILGALADGDIGAHFPPSDPKFKGAASSLFLADAVQRVKARGGLLAHVDATLICERPKIGPHRDAIRENLAKVMGVALSRVALKATTSERLGFTGRGEGIAAMATATIRLPFEG